MKRTICDGCGECRDQFGWDSVSVPCHIAEKRHGYVDGNMNQVSGRTVDFDLCNKCANIVNTATFAALNELRRAHVRPTLPEASCK
jgi:TPP-dependent indolepyruvate ferredoxin oxidoreductase alpha subunit